MKHLMHSRSEFFSRRLLLHATMFYLLAFYYRFPIYFFIRQVYPVPFEFFFKVTTLITVALLLGMYLITTPLRWRIGRHDMFMLLCGCVFASLAVLQGASEGFMISFQIWLLPFFLRWTRYVQRRTIVTVLMCIALGTSIFFVCEFVALNNSWLGFLSSDSPLLTWVARWRELYVPDMLNVGSASYGVRHGDVEMETLRPYGVNGYIVNSGVALAMVCSFFVMEALAFHRLRDVVIALVSFIGLITSTSTTSIVAFLCAFVLVNVMTRPRGFFLFYGSATKRLFFYGLIALCAIGLWPVLSWIWFRMYHTILFGESAIGMGYTTSFFTSFGSLIDVGRFILGGNFWELAVRHTTTQWQYQDTALLIRESNFINFFAFFGLMPMIFLYSKWLAPLTRVRNTQYVTHAEALPFLMAFITGIFTMVHDHGIIFWQNTVFFFLYLEMARRYQMPMDATSKADSA